MDAPDTISTPPPSEPEKLYVNRGNEPTPEPRAAPGHCVYFNDPGEDSYFIRSRLKAVFQKIRYNTGYIAYPYPVPKKFRVCVYDGYAMETLIWETKMFF